MVKVAINCINDKNVHLNEGVEKETSLNVCYMLLFQETIEIFKRHFPCFTYSK